MLIVRDLEKSFSENFFKRKKVLKGVSFEINPQRITGFLGPNGAGKTTTLKIIIGLLKADRGRIEIFGKEINNDLRRKIGYLPEIPSFYPFLTPKEFLYIIGRMEGMMESSILKKIQELSKELLFEEFLDKPIKALSKGTLQKVAFSQALIGDKELIILDEPFSGLDPIVMNEIRDYILALKEQKRTILLSSHMLSEMERICDDVVLINNGKIVLEGNILKLKERWWIVRGLEKELKKSLIKEGHIKDFIQKILDDKEVFNFTNTESFKSKFSMISSPTLEEIFLEAVRFEIDGRAV